MTDAQNRMPNDWFEVHLARGAYKGQACVTYKYGGPQDPERSFSVPPGTEAGCRGDKTITGEYPTVTIHELGNEDPDAGAPWVVLANAWTLRSPSNQDIVSLTIVIKGAHVRASVRSEDGTCGEWEKRVLVPVKTCLCAGAGPSGGCKTPPCD